MNRAVILSSALALLIAVAAPHVHAQTPPGGGTQTATQFYMTFRAAFAKASKVEELFPFMSAAQRAQVEKTPAAERPEMFKMLKEFNNFTNVKVLKETKTATGATLEVEAIEPDSKSKVSATVEILREGSEWRVGKENWKG